MKRDEIEAMENNLQDLSRRMAAAAQGCGPAVTVYDATLVAAASAFVSALAAGRDAALEKLSPWAGVIDRIMSIERAEDQVLSDEFLTAQSIRVLKQAEAERDAALAREARMRGALRWIAETWASDVDWPGGAEEEASSYASHARAALGREGEG